MQVREKRYYTVEEYLALEEKANSKSEYINGEIIPIAGASDNHNQIALNFSTELNFAFKRQNYRVYISDMRLWIPKQRIYTYPDVMVVAGESEFLENRKDIITNPKVIIEVLSKSTESYDREDKFKAYSTIPSFEEYLLIEQDEIYIRQYSKTANKRWSLQEYDDEDEKISLVTVPFEITLQDLYNKVKFDTLQTVL
ncbi:MAG: Uma2 family endonuclease [Calothrix sp. C42_A2020_038]|nr:Uma2 family endonuclease [Calothrix sp. C42_A2020_038]